MSTETDIQLIRQRFDEKFSNLLPYQDVGMTAIHDLDKACHEVCGVAAASRHGIYSKVTGQIDARLRILGEKNWPRFVTYNEQSTILAIVDAALSEV